MRARITAALSRHKIGLLVTALATVLLASLLIWYANRSGMHVDVDCMVKDADGNWHLGPCE
jgi:hypothetical protein